MSISVIGGGAWGTAMAQVIASSGEAVTLWAREPEVVASIVASGENSLFLPGVKLASGIRATEAMSEATEAKTLLIVAPAQHLRSVLADIPVHGQNLILCTKGIEQGSGRLMVDFEARKAQ